MSNRLLPCGMLETTAIGKSTSASRLQSVGINLCLRLVQREFYLCLLLLLFRLVL